MNRLAAFVTGMLAGAALLWWLLGKDDDPVPAEPEPTPPTLHTVADKGFQTSGSSSTLTFNRGFPTAVNNSGSNLVIR